VQDGFVHKLKKPIIEVCIKFRQLSLIDDPSISWLVDYALVAFLGQARIQAASSHKRRNAMTSFIMSNHNH